jgi:uncharacterized protein with PQ loop repeat
MIFAYIALTLYLIVAFIIHVGMLTEYKKDKSGDLSDFSDTFIKICLLGGALLWFVLLIVEIVKRVKEK